MFTFSILERTNPSNANQRHSIKYIIDGFCKSIIHIYLVRCSMIKNKL